MATWGVLRLPDGSVSGGLDTGDGAVAAAVAAHLDGAVALGHDVPLALALASLPAHVDMVVEIDAEDAATGQPGALIARLVAELDADHAAAIAARPVADALKQVEGDVVQGGLDRDGLFTLSFPRLYRRETLTAVLAAAASAAAAVAVTVAVAVAVDVDVDAGVEPGGDVDVIGLLLDGGHAVRVVPVDGGPATSLHTDQRRP
jgi:hypothetical protein